MGLDQHAEQERRQDILSEFEEDLLQMHRATTGIEALDQVIPTSEETQQADDFLVRLKTYASTGKAGTFRVRDERNRLINHHQVDNYQQLERLKVKLENLPNFEGEPINNKGVILALARKLKVLPRRFPDNYVYETGSAPEYVSGKEEGRMSAVYNCFKINFPGLPYQIYWHEIYAGDNFSSYVEGVVITVNKSFSETISPISRLKQLFHP